MADLQSKVPLNLYEPSDHLNHSYSLRARKAARNYDLFRAKNDEVVVVQLGGGDQASLRNIGDGGSGSDSGYCSPPLWKSEPETKKQQQLDYQCLSAEAKSQAVARGQRELMEMIKNMPESDYELTLKDLVERQRKPTGEEDEGKEYRSSDALFRKKEGDKEKNGSREILRKQQKKRIDHKNIQKPVLRSSSINNNNNNGGFLLNMVLPLGFGFLSKKKMNPKATGLVSPKPLPPPVLDGGGKAVEKEWWKKRFAGSGDSESLGMSSNNSGSSGSSSSSRSTRSINKEKAGFGCGVWSCFRVKIQKEK